MFLTVKRRKLRLNDGDWISFEATCDFEGEKYTFADIYRVDNKRSRREFRTIVKSKMISMFGLEENHRVGWDWVQ